MLQTRSRFLGKYNNVSSMINYCEMFCELKLMNVIEKQLFRLDLEEHTVKVNVVWICPVLVTFTKFYYFYLEVLNQLE